MLILLLHSKDYIQTKKSKKSHLNPFITIKHKCYKTNDLLKVLKEVLATYIENHSGVKSTINNALKNPAKPTPKLNISKLLRKSLLTSHKIRESIIHPKA